MFTMSWRRWTRLDLKDQYFGCEIEMTGITREQAAQAVAALFGTTARQTHESHTYDPWEVTDNAGKKWRFVYDGSIETTRRECGRQAAVHDRRYSVEMNSPKCALPGFVDSKNEEKTERNAGYLVVSHSGGGMLRQGTRKGIRRTPANRGMRAHRIVKSLDISEDVCHGLCP